MDVTVNTHTVAVATQISCAFRMGNLGWDINGIVVAENCKTSRISVQMTNHYYKFVFVMLLRRMPQRCANGLLHNPTSFHTNRENASPYFEAGMFQHIVIMDQYSSTAKSHKHTGGVLCHLITDLKSTPSNMSKAWHVDDLAISL